MRYLVALAYIGIFVLLAISGLVYRRAKEKGWL